MAGDEACGRGLLDDDVDYVPAVEIARLAEERLLTVVVVIFDELEIGRVVAHGVERQRLPERPAGEGAGSGLDVILRVVADTHREQLEQLTPVVLVDRALVIFIVVQPEDHGGIAGEL